MRNYKCLQNQIFESEGFHIEPLRDEDKYEIMAIRNEQIYHLRQSKQLTIEDQENYFANVVAKLFEEEKPSQLLYSFFYKNEFIGYGGLVHINWIDKNAEISFVMKTALEKENFAKNWINYLNLIERVVFQELKFHKIFTYAFDLRPHLYIALEERGFKEEARLKEHCFFDNVFYDVVYHTKFNQEIFFRKPENLDVDLYFEWANDELVRSFSYQTEPVVYESHVNWFNTKLKDENCFMYLFENHIGRPVGQVRIQKNNNQSIIGVSVDDDSRGKGMASKMLLKASNSFLKQNPSNLIHAYIKKDNIASVNAFKTAGFQFQEELEYLGAKSYLYTKT